MFRQKQLLVLAGMTAAAIAGVAVVFFIDWGAPVSPPADAGERLAFAARWMLVPGLALFAGVGVTANRRFFMETAIDGERRVESPAFGACSAGRTARRHRADGRDVCNRPAGFLDRLPLRALGEGIRHGIDGLPNVWSADLSGLGRAAITAAKRLSVDQLCCPWRHQPQLTCHCHVGRKTCSQADATVVRSDMKRLTHPNAIRSATAPTAAARPGRRWSPGRFTMQARFASRGASRKYAPPRSMAGAISARIAEQACSTPARRFSPV
jgi:hypothetical protein